MLERQARLDKPRARVREAALGAGGGAAAPDSMPASPLRAEVITILRGLRRPALPRDAPGARLPGHSAAQRQWKLPLKTSCMVLLTPSGKWGPLGTISPGVFKQRMQRRTMLATSWCRVKRCEAVLALPPRRLG